jgi:hypothetical protein
VCERERERETERERERERESAKERESARKRERNVNNNLISVPPALLLPLFAHLSFPQGVPLEFRLADYFKADLPVTFWCF